MTGPSDSHGSSPSSLGKQARMAALKSMDCNPNSGPIWPCSGPVTARICSICVGVLLSVALERWAINRPKSALRLSPVSIRASQAAGSPASQSSKRSAETGSTVGTNKAAWERLAKAAERLASSLARRTSIDAA